MLEIERKLEASVDFDLGDFRSRPGDLWPCRFGSWVGSCHGLLIPVQRRVEGAVHRRNINPSECEIRRIDRAKPGQLENPPDLLKPRDDWVHGAVPRATRRERRPGSNANCCAPTMKTGLRREDLPIPSPCDADWDTMTPEG